MAFIDPPYNVPIEGNVSGLGKIHHREFAMARGEMSDDEFVNFLTDAFILLVRYSARGSIHFVFMDWRHLAQVLAAGLDAYTGFKNLCIWAKNTAGMGSFIAARTNLYSFSRMVTHVIATTCSWGVRPKSDERLALSRCSRPSQE